MQEEWAIKSKVRKALKDHRVCFFCKRFFCTKYHYPRHRLVCSGIWPQWDWLYFLMREVKSTDTCKKFVINKIFEKQRRR